MNLMLVMMLCTKAAYCCHQNESSAGLKEDNEYQTQLPLTAPIVPSVIAHGISVRQIRRSVGEEVTKRLVTALVL